MSAVKRREIQAISDAAWSPVAKRDRRADGAFVYAAVTTGLYCRPSCPARHPHRRNTLLFPTAEEAERDGFAPCSRCSPGSDSLTLAEQCVKAVIEYVDIHFTGKITLATLSRLTGLCPNHLQETFKRIVGVSPKALCDAKRLRHFKQLLRTGGTISAAVYATGYESSRAVYEQSGRRIGMTPSMYQRGGEGVTVRYSILRAALGRLLIASTGRGICALLLGADDKRLIAELRAEFPKATLIRARTAPRQWAGAVEACQPEDPLVSKLPRASRNELFQAKMAKALLVGNRTPHRRRASAGSE
jgi:AraC family transcriptional regulator of adaptative response/methylated-DNA-[protein]-cysteine methyltransferase